tara:strand:+ start:896 stop:1858 length:963 start_codon:yes stop_codon:yes gene_type:complete
MAFKKISIPNDLSRLGDIQLKKIENSNPKERIFIEGMSGNKKLEPTPNYNKSDCEIIAAEGENNTQIVMGRDRPSSKFSGYGGRGDTHCGSIDIVAGRMGNEVRSEDSSGNKVFTDPHFTKDAARIYISQKTDIDKNFNLAEGAVGMAETRSGIAIKADGVRIVAREGIKLVTQVDKLNSLGGKVLAIKGIDLIAGNDDSDLQPLVKGQNLLELLRYMVEDIRKLTGMINSLTTASIKMNSVLAAHTHPILPGGNPVTAPLPGAAPSIELGIIAVTDSMGKVIVDFQSQVSSTINSITGEMDYLKAGGNKFIISKYNNTN